MYALFLTSFGMLTWGAAETLIWYKFSPSYAEVEDASVKSDIQETTRQALTSANALRVSVEDRRLSLDVYGKSARVAEPT
jgi:hypothetical protein